MKTSNSENKLVQATRLPDDKWLSFGDHQQISWVFSILEVETRNHQVDAFFCSSKGFGTKLRSRNHHFFCFGGLGFQMAMQQTIETFCFSLVLLWFSHACHKSSKWLTFETTVQMITCTNSLQSNILSHLSKIIRVVIRSKSDERPHAQTRPKGQHSFDLQTRSSTDLSQRKCTNFESTPPLEPETATQRLSRFNLQTSAHVRLTCVNGRCTWKAPAPGCLFSSPEPLHERGFCSGYNFVRPFEFAAGGCSMWFCVL